MPKRGLFLAFEGGEGSGKTTLVAAIAAALEGRGCHFIALREPGGTPLGETIRSMLLEKEAELDSKAELCLFLAARSQNICQNIVPALKEGKIVLCDRFNASTIAYQGYARGLGMQGVANLCRWVAAECVPDMTFYLDLDPQIGLQRSQARQQGSDRIESEDGNFHLAVREGFLHLAEQSGPSFITVDASQPKAEVFNQVWAKILPQLL